MKILNLIGGVAITASFLAVSCKDSDKDKSKTPEVDTVVSIPHTTVTDEPVRIAITKEEVPEKAMMAFSKKEPKATNVQYAKVEKKGTNAPDSVVYYYYFDYDRDNWGYWLVYDDEGMVVEDNSYPKIAGLPDPVSKTVDQYFRGYKIVEQEKGNDKDMVIYELELEKGDLKRKVKIMENGGISKLK